MPQKNPFPWPSISNASVAVDGRVSSFLDSAKMAQTVIATAWRRSRPNHEVPDETWRNLIRRWRGKLEAQHIHFSHGFHSYFLGQDCVATQKYDGTNVGITEDGLMLGRRLVIDGDAPKYQGVPLDHVKKSLGSVGAVKQGILTGVAPDDTERLHCVVYGELMCNPGKFDYRDRDLGGAFACFGAMLRFTQVCNRLSFVVYENISLICIVSTKSSVFLPSLIQPQEGDDLASRVEAVLTAAGFEVASTKELADPMNDNSEHRVQIKLMMYVYIRAGTPQR